MFYSLGTNLDCVQDSADIYPLLKQFLELKVSCPNLFTRRPYATSHNSGAFTALRTIWFYMLQYNRPLETTSRIPCCLVMFPTFQYPYRKCASRFLAMFKPPRGWLLLKDFTMCCGKLSTCLWLSDIREAVITRWRHLTKAVNTT